ncbi:hypothetical protein M885DRAFT_507702 [Pelagophyceae sp. CCMP2097]|nr:hypothetical protein M885DRAFT_507702 [Pelagophyceae sp. CCMP2097]
MGGRASKPRRSSCEAYIGAASAALGVSKPRRSSCEAYYGAASAALGTASNALDLRLRHLGELSLEVPRTSLKLRFNSPAVLVFVFSAALPYALLPQALVRYYFSAPPWSLSKCDVLTLWRLFAHVLGHDSWSHFRGNAGVLLLLGPGLEEKYGSALLLGIMLLAAFATGAAHCLASGDALMGASSTAFLFISLAPFTNVRHKEVPITALLVAGGHLFGELRAATSHDAISQSAHILGGAIGAAVGYAMHNPRAAPHRAR